LEIAYLEKEESEAGPVRQWLEDAGHRCHHAAGTEELAKLLRQQAFDAVLMDWDLPGLSPRDVLENVREYSGRVPLMLASHRRDQASIVEALSSGADDYMVKPLARDELLARLATLRRRVAEQSLADRFRLGPWEVDRGEREIRMHGKPVRLTEKDFELASFFFRHPGKLLTRRELFREIWGINTPIESRTVDVHVSRIRRSLQIEPRNGFQIKTVYQHGYRLEQTDD
jgi:DNA-binding response OmpR family regulator